MKDKQLQEIIHILLRLVEPKLVQGSSPESLEIFESEQACVKPSYLYIINNAFYRIANSLGNNFIDGVNLSRIDEDTYLEAKMLKVQLNVDEYVKDKIKAYSYNPVTIDTILAILELKYDEDETIQAQKQALLRCLIRLNSRRLMQEYVRKLGEEQATLAEINKLIVPLMGARRAQTATKTKQRIFDRLSKNALQNVMSFFEYKGTDFMKMRSINKKSKSSYMQEL